MNKQGEVRFVLVLFGVLVVVVLGIVFLITSGPPANVYPLPTPNSECNILSYNGESAIDLVFFADEATTQKYMDHLLETEPYNQFPSAFNTYYINQEIECETYKDIAILCHSRELLQEAGACPHDFTIVLTDAGNLRSSAYQGVGSINTNHPMSVFTHEVGHLFLSLDEEYLPASAHTDSVNCKDACDEFVNPDGCYAGCSEGDLYRSIDNGVMRTLNTNDYGAHNELEIIEWLTENTGQTPSTITGNVINEGADEAIAACFKNNYLYIKTDPIINEVIDEQLLIGCSPKKHPHAPSTAVLTQNGAHVYVQPYDSFLYTEEPGVETEFINDEKDGVDLSQPVALTLPAYLDAPADTLELFNEEGNLQQSVSLIGLGGTPCVI